MIELFKILIEEPEKMRKGGLYALKFILNFIFATKLFLWIVGIENALNPISIASWSEFITSGRILIFVFVYLLSELLLFQILSGFSIYPLQYISEKISVKRLGKEERKYILWLLKFNKVIVQDEKTMVISAGDNAKAFKDFLALFSTEESKEELKTLRRSLLNKVCHTYFVFVILYFTGIKIPHSGLLTFFIILMAVCLGVFYVVVCKLIEFMVEHSDGLLHSLRAAYLGKMLPKYLSEIGVLNFDFLESEYKRTDELISYKNKNYLINFHVARTPIALWDIQNIYDQQIQNGKRVAIISNSVLSSDVKDKIEEYSQSLIFIKFNSEDDLKDSLINFFKTKAN